jgi:hypothetical protein
MLNHNADQKMSGIPMPIVTLNRSILCIGILIAIATQQFWITTILFMILLPAVLFGRKYSLFYRTGMVLFKNSINNADFEDASLQRFNNGIATLLLGISQIAFLFNQSLTGWIFSGMVMVASGVALAGFCVGCFLYYQFKLQKYRFFRSN